MRLIKFKYGDINVTAVASPFLNDNRPEEGQPEENNMETKEVIKVSGGDLPEGNEVYFNENCKFIGTKIIHATDMTLGEYNKFRGWTIPEKENPAREGYLVRYEDGYISWSPKEVFEASYRRTSKMNFGLAVEAMREGKAVCRAGWNGKGMCIYMNKGSKEIPMNRGELVDGVPFDGMFEQGDTGTVTRLPNINMKTATGSTVTGWLASQTDIFALDWMIVE